MAILKSVFIERIVPIIILFFLCIITNVIKTGSDIEPVKVTVHNFYNSRIQLRFNNDSIMAQS